MSVKVRGAGVQRAIGTGTTTTGLTTVTCGFQPKTILLYIADYTGLIAYYSTNTNLGNQGKLGLLTTGGASDVGLSISLTPTANGFTFDVTNTTGAKSVTFQYEALGGW